MGSAILVYGPECLIVPLATRKKVVEMKRGKTLAINDSFLKKSAPLKRFTGTPTR